MLTVSGNEVDGQVTFQARSNFSLGARGLIALILALAAVTLVFAAVLALQGYWPVLAFAVAQLILVAWLLIRAWEYCWILEEIEVSARSVRIVRRTFRSQRQALLDPAWTRVCLEQPAFAAHPPKLLLRCKSEQIELGDFLTIEEKLRLAAHIKQALSPHSAWKSMQAEPLRTNHFEA